MSTRRQNVTVSREYNPAPDDCARALHILFDQSVTKMAAEPTPGPDAAVRVKYGEEVSHVEQRTRSTIRNRQSPV
jgi:hypothetical protein